MSFRKPGACIGIVRLIYCFYFALGLSLTSFGEDPKYFDVEDLGEPAADSPKIQPWKVVQLDPEYGGLWVVTGDVDGDGEADIVSSENTDSRDVHYTTTAVAQKLDGTVLWRWGDPDTGIKPWRYDVACQIHDWDGDGKNEVVVLTKGALVELDGATGEERRRIPIATQATDCIVFCNLSGGDRASDVLVKDRYWNIWAYNLEGNLLWTAKEPGGYKTAHQPRPIDLDGDGRHEIMAGYAMLNPDGSARWVYESKAVKHEKGHLDCVRVLREGKTPEDFRLALTCCGADNMAVVDGTGKVCWEIPGHHFESIQVGRMISDHPGPQILVDIAHKDTGPMWVVGEHGKFLGRIVLGHSRHHRVLDWTGDGINEIMEGESGAVYDGKGKRIAVLDGPESPTKGSFERSILKADMTGNGAPDVLLVTPETVAIFKNDKGRKPAKRVPLGTGLNFTLY